MNELNQPLMYLRFNFGHRVHKSQTNKCQCLLAQYCLFWSYDTIYRCIWETMLMCNFSCSAIKPDLWTLTGSVLGTSWGRNLMFYTKENSVKLLQRRRSQSWENKRRGEKQTLTWREKGCLKKDWLLTPNLRVKLFETSMCSI